MNNKQKTRINLYSILTLFCFLLCINGINNAKAQVSAPLDVEIIVFGYSTTLTWNEPVADLGGGAFSYTIQRGVNTDDWVDAGTTSTLTFTDDDLSPGKYFYRIRAMNSAGYAYSTIEIAEIADVGLMAITGVAIAGIAALAGLGAIFILKKKQLSAEEIV
ncbi:MAG: fibronectin type III domain-containing protein [archaeon]|nr:fibronectin type III domain-containing protein [archaeon]